MDVLRLFVAACMLSLAPQAFAVDVPAAEIEKLTTLEGAPFKTEKDKVLLYFWATWCPDCKEKLANEFPKLGLPSDVELVTVNTDKDVDRTKHLVSKEKYMMTIVRDSGKTVASALKVFSVPFWAVLKRGKDKSWTVVDSEAGGDLTKAKAAWSRN